MKHTKTKSNDQKICREPVAIGNMSQEELTAEIQKGFDSIQAGNYYTAAEVDAMLKEKFGI